MNRFHHWFCRSGIWKKTLEIETFPWVFKEVELGSHILEVGPGPGLTTDLLRQRFQQVTALEIDHQLAQSLKKRLEQTKVQVVEGDATAMPFTDHSFSGVVSMNMLHHIPSAELQDRLLREVLRVLNPNGMFVGTDGTENLAFRLMHVQDTMTPVNPDSFGERLAKAGFQDVLIEKRLGRFRFQARRG